MFVDETGANTKMVRLYGRCRSGKRLVCKTPWGHWKTTTFTCGLRCDGLVAPWVLEGPMTGDAFRVYVEDQRLWFYSTGWWRRQGRVRPYLGGNVRRFAR